MLVTLVSSRQESDTSGHGFKGVDEDGQVQKAVLASQPGGQDYQKVAQILADLHLRYEPSKTRLTSFSQGFDFLGVHFEETWYWYLWQDKRIEVRAHEIDWLFGEYGPDYE